MAIRYDSQSKTGDFDALDNEGRGRRVRFGGQATGQRVATDVFFEFDDCPEQLGIQIPAVRQANIEILADRVRFTSNALDVELYTKAGHEGQQNQFQLDAVLKTRSAANAAVNFALQLVNTSQFTFGYVAPFVPVGTELRGGELQEISADGVGRSPWMQGGWIVRHVGWQNNRKTSKYCQITRPKLIAADLSESWGTVNYNASTGQLEYVFDPAFLANAPLPITLDPTFGITSAGGDTFPMDDGRALVQTHNLSEAGDTLSVWIYASRSGAACSTKGLIYSDSSGTPATLQYAGAGVAVGTSAAWLESVISTGSLSSGDYFIGAVANSFTGLWYHDAGSGRNVDMANSGGSMDYTSPPSSWPGTDGSYDWDLSVYVEYTASGGGSAFVPSLHGAVKSTIVRYH